MFSYAFVHLSTCVITICPFCLSTCNDIWQYAKLINLIVNSYVTITKHKPRFLNMCLVNNCVWLLYSLAFINIRLAAHSLWRIHPSLIVIFQAFVSVMSHIPRYGPLARYVKLRVAHAPGILGTFSPPPRVSDPDMHHGTCVTHVPWCMPGSRSTGFLWSRRWVETFPAFPAHAQPEILRIW